MNEYKIIYGLVLIG